MDTQVPAISRGDGLLMETFDLGQQLSDDRKAGLIILDKKEHQLCHHVHRLETVHTGQ